MMREELAHQLADTLELIFEDRERTLWRSPDEFPRDPKAQLLAWDGSRQAVVTWHPDGYWQCEGSAFGFVPVKMRPLPLGPPVVVPFDEVRGILKTTA